MFDLRNLVAPYLAALWRGRWTAMVIAWCFCLAGWITVAMLPNTYTSTARMFVDTDTLLSPLMRDLAVAPDFDRQVEMMRKTLFSLPHVEELIERTDLDANIKDPLERAGLIERLTGKLYLSVLGQNLFEIGYHDGDPEVAHNVVKVMLDIFVEQQLGHSQRDVEIAGAFIDEQIAAYDEKLRAAELRVAQFQREHAEELGGVERGMRDLDHAESELRRLKAELESAYWRRDQLTVRLDSTPKTVSSAQAGGANPSPVQQQLLDLNRELTRKLLLYTQQHPDIVSLKQLIAQANEQVKSERQGNQITDVTVPNPLFDQLNSQLQVIEVSIDDLTRRLNVAESESRVLSAKIKQAPKVEADLKRLNRDYDVLLSRYDQLTQKRESAQLARDLDEGKKRIEFRLVDPPVRPLQPSGPPHGLFLLAVLVLGLGAGSAFVIGRFVISDTVMTSSQLQSAFPSLPILGGVSEAQAPGQWTGQLSSRLGFVGSGVTLLALFVTVFYFYAISSDKPNLVEIATALTNNLISMDAKAEP